MLEGMPVSAPSLPARTRIVRRRAGSVASLSPVVSRRTHPGGNTLPRVALVVLSLISATKSLVTPSVFELTYWVILGSVPVCDGLLTGGLTRLTRGA